MTTLGFTLALVGSGVAILSPLVDLFHRWGGPRTKARIDSIDARFSWRRNTQSPAQLRQLLAVAGAAILIVLAVYQGGAVYIGLQTLLLLSGLLWYPTFGAEGDALARIERWKGVLRIILALFVWGTLEWFGLCPGFHRTGVLGLELLACAFILQSPLARDSLAFLGAFCLMLYGGLGVLLDPDAAFTHWTWFLLNMVYSVFTFLNVFDTIFARTKAKAAPASASVAEMSTDV